MVILHNYKMEIFPWLLNPPNSQKSKVTCAEIKDMTLFSKIIFGDSVETLRKSKYSWNAKPGLLKVPAF